MPFWDSVQKRTEREAAGVNQPPGPSCWPTSPWWERESLSPVFGASSWELDVTQLPWDTEARAAHFHAIPIPRHFQKCLEEGFSFSLSSRDGQVGIWFFSFLSQRFHLGFSPSRIIALCLPAFLPMGSSGRHLSPLPLEIPLRWKGRLAVPQSPSRASRLLLVCILFCQVWHHNTLSNKPS